MVQFVDMPNRGSRLGTLLGTGLGQGLQVLAQAKLNQIAQRNAVNQLQGLGLPEQDAAYLASLPPKEQWQAVQGFLERAGSLAQEQHQPQSLEALLKAGSVSSQSQPQETLSQQAKKGTSLSQAYARPSRAEQLKEQREIDKETLPIYTETIKAGKAAENSDKRLDRMETLINKGDLSYPAWASLVKAATKGIFGFGVDLTSLLTADSQEFDKLSTDFLKDAKDVFGSRLTNYDVENYLKTVPTLTQSEAGKRRVIANLRSFNKAARLRAKAAREIIAANGGKRPRNLDALIDERVGNDLDQLANSFKMGSENAAAERSISSAFLR